ncbi:MAG: hypothetical protein CVU46_00020 [Chloroflexi bacterium HGW-Chloroflexi-8]|jgi:glycosyltransferase involved in cell wall biosynthesis|nr:MAG: hypothetical protein CVU46_00020 [Chloroflexi bacterium HGW-Chloroflexi-8]
MIYPKITVIVPSYNQSQYLEETIVSILDQYYPKLELFVLDGGSNDGSLTIIERYSKHISFYYCHKDEGQSAAIHYGILKATGLLAGWINSDDLLLPKSLNKIAESYNRHPTGSLFAGNLAFINHEGIITSFLRMPSSASWFAKKGIYAVSQPGSFFRVTDYNLVGGINHDLHYVMDNDLYLRMLIKGKTFVYLDHYLAAFRRHENQKTTAFADRTLEEEKQLDLSLRSYGIKYKAKKYLMLYYFWQSINGNYIRKKIDTKKHIGKHWRSVFSGT